MKLFNREPALFLGVIQSGIALAVIFGLNLPDGADAAIMAFSATVMSLIVRSRVTPTAR